MDKALACRRVVWTIFNGDIRCVWPIVGVVALTACSSAQAPTITIVSGTYGQNCGAPRGDATHDLVHQCDGRTTCQYTLTTKLTADPTMGCRKDLLVEWLCGDTEFHSAALSPEAGPGSTLVLSCVREAGAGK